MGVAYRAADLFFFTGRLVGGAQGVIEDNDPFGPGGSFDQFLGLLVVQVANFVLVVKVFHLGLVIDEGESFTLQGHLVGDGAGIVDRHLVGFVLAFALLIGYRLSHAAVACWLFATLHEVVEG